MACFGEDVWKPVAHLEVLSDEVHQLDLSRVYLFLLTAHLYTTFGMASVTMPPVLYLQDFIDLLKIDKLLSLALLFSLLVELLPENFKQ